jgi:hypothetical protein
MHTWESRYPTNFMLKIFMNAFKRKGRKGCLFTWGMTENVNYSMLVGEGFYQTRTAVTAHRTV